MVVVADPDGNAFTIRRQKAGDVTQHPSQKSENADDR